jgi:hypothetical protein
MQFWSVLCTAHRIVDFAVRLGGGGGKAIIKIYNLKINRGSYVLSPTKNIALHSHSKILKFTPLYRSNVK